MPRNQTSELLRQIRQLLEEQRPKKRPWWWKPRFLYLLAGIAFLSVYQFNSEARGRAHLVLSQGSRLLIEPPSPAFIAEQLRRQNQPAELVDFISQHGIWLYVSTKDSSGQRTEVVFLGWPEPPELDAAPEKHEEYEQSLHPTASVLRSPGTAEVTFVSRLPWCDMNLDGRCWDDGLRRVALQSMLTSRVFSGDQMVPLFMFTTDSLEKPLVVEVIPPIGPDRLLSNLERVYSLFF